MTKRKKHLKTLVLLLLAMVFTVVSFSKSSLALEEKAQD